MSSAFLKELHTLLEIQECRKRRIRFLTDAKIVVFFVSFVVCSVVLTVVLAS